MSIRKFLEHIKTIFLNGLFTLLPLTITIALLNYSFKIIQAWLIAIYLLEPRFLQNIPLSGVFLFVAFILLVGLISRFFLIDQLWKLFESTVSRIPLLRPIYFGVKKLIEAISGKDKTTHQKVVLVEFPRSGVYSIGFQTTAIPAPLAPNNATTYYSVFIPATPNPTSGFYVLVAQDECRVLDLTKQEALSLIISGGIIQPERFKTKISQ